MLFNAEIYYLFLPLVAGLFFVLPAAWRWLLLLAASLVFYGWWRWSYLLLILATSLLDGWIGIRLGRTENPSARKALLGLSLSSNLGVLFVFKYYNFFRDTSVAAGWAWPFPASDLLLPVGISFFVFQSLSYTIDVYRRRLQPEPSLPRLVLFVSFFPQLVAGPIERAANLLPQLRRLTAVRWDWSRARGAAMLILWGLFKKAFIADRLSIWVDAVWAQPEAAGGFTLLLAAWFFAWQIYCDFSGYSDIAIGSARLFGVDLMENFRQPYYAPTTQEFWRRWHISLSTWFRDYLYLPLGGSKAGRGRFLFNLAIVFLVSGLWHGANWTFLAWGAWHGALVIVSHLTLAARDRWAERMGLPRWLVNGWRILITFQLVALGWILFRSTDIHQAMAIYGRIAAAPLDFDGIPLIVGRFNAALSIAGIGVLLAVHLAQRLWPGWRHFEGQHPALGYAWAYFLLFAVLLGGIFDSKPFIYFQF